MNERAQLIAALARYLTTNIGRKTHELIEGRQDAINWALAFKMLHLPFNATAQQAEAALNKVLDAEATYPAMREVTQ